MCGDCIEQLNLRCYWDLSPEWSHASQGVGQCWMMESSDKIGEPRAKQTWASLPGGGKPVKVHKPRRHESSRCMAAMNQDRQVQGNLTEVSGVPGWCFLCPVKYLRHDTWHWQISDPWWWAQGRACLWLTQNEDWIICNIITVDATTDKKQHGKTDP